MRNYCKVSPRLWTGSLGKRLRGDAQAQALAAYLVSGPHANMIGLYHLPVGYIELDLGWTAKAAAKALRRLASEGFIRYDEEHERVWVVEHARIEFGDGMKLGDNRIKGIHGQLADHSNSALVEEFVGRYGRAFHLDAEALRSPSADPFEAPSEGLANQEQDQEQDQEQEREQEVPTRPEPAAPASGRSEDESPDLVVMEFPVIANGEIPWCLRGSKLAEYADTFPHLDVGPELRRARQWLIDNPAKRKTPKGMPKFLFGWLERRQNGGRGRAASLRPPTPGSDESRRQRAAALDRELGLTGDAS